MNANCADDMRLARRVVAGDESALEVLYARHADPLFAFIYHHVEESRLDAEEIWQETLLTALRSLRTYRGQSQLFTWLCGIARHKIADYYRRHGRGPEAFSDLSPAELAALAGTDPLPEDVLARAAARVRVVEALATLPEDYRAALVARYADGCSVGEIAQALGRTYKAAESLLSRARAAFRSAFSGIEGSQH